MILGSSENSSGSSPLGSLAMRNPLLAVLIGRKSTSLNPAHSVAAMPARSQSLTGIFAAS